MEIKGLSSRNRTILVSDEDIQHFRSQLVTPDNVNSDVLNRVICMDMLDGTGLVPDASVDLLILDPPYNLDKQFADYKFKSMTNHDYAQWFESWFLPMLRTLKQTATIYVCGDWRSSMAIQSVLEKHVVVRNRITWEREKGRGSLHNWKNASEDIWFATVSDDYFFDPSAVKLKRKVMAPYRNEAGMPKDWTTDEEAGTGYRLTHPSNLWTDLTVPFWSMAENTMHPTQKPEKLIAKLILASSEFGDVVFDPFLGSGTTAVTAKKLGRSFFAIEREEEFAVVALKRLQIAEQQTAIQGYEDGVFWERNTNAERKGAKKTAVPQELE